MKITRNVKAATNTSGIMAKPDVLDEDEVDIDELESITADSESREGYIRNLIEKVENKLVDNIDGATWDYGDTEMYLTISVADTDQLLEFTIPYDDLTMKNITADTNTIVDAVMESIEKVNSRYKFIKSKTVEDSDGFNTDYTMYYDTEEDRYVFVFGDRDLYSPEDGYFDWETEDKESAEEWFDNYTGFEDEEDYIESDDYLNDKW